MAAFKNWLRDGFVKPSHQGRRGTQNIFSFEDVLYAALFKRMVDLGGGTQKEVAFFLQENVQGWNSLARARREGKKYLSITEPAFLVGTERFPVFDFCNEIPTEGIEKGEGIVLYVINLEALEKQIRTFLLKGKHDGEQEKAKLRIIERFDSQENFAHALGVHPSLVSKVINNRYPVKEEEKAVWARLLKCEPGELFSA